ncbi:MAG: N-formylglutamate amidohydrolase [Rhodobacterales bacterium]|nr:MAG: N-formylglutamate amidohydrolase [Rhodobacterales bacterium]
MQMTQIETDWSPVHIHGEDRDSRWLVTCDHASNTIPPMVNGGTLGLAAEDMNRHIAYDVGAAGLAMALADGLGAPAVLSDFSRLVIDPNRGADDPTVLMKLYDGTVVPGNRHADADEKARRVALMHEPYHAEVARMAARRPDTVILAIHSFTPQLRGKPARPWHVGVLHAPHGGALSRPLIARLHAEPDLCVGDNEPYAGHLEGDSIDRHALVPDRLNTLVELRNDLIETPEQQVAWAERLTPILQAALADVTHEQEPAHG